MNELYGKSPVTLREHSPKRIDVFGRGETRAHRDVPHIAMRTSIVGRAGSRIPRPLVHRNEVHVALVLVPLAGFAARRRWSAFVLGGTVALVGAKLAEKRWDLAFDDVRGRAGLPREPTLRA